MFKNYIKVAFRHIIRHKAYSFINITGLSVGMACCLLIFFWVYNEISFDRFHQKVDRIYRLTEFTRSADGFVRNRVSTPPPLSEALVREFPDVEEATRFYRMDGVVKAGDDIYREKDLFFGEANVFRIFSFNLKYGDPDKALVEPYSVVISQSLAEKYFAGKAPLGEVLTLENHFNLTVTGVLDDIPANSHLKFDFLASYETLLSMYPGLRNHWEAGGWTYVLLRENYNPQIFEKKLSSLITKYRGEDRALSVTLGLQPLKDIHLYSNYGGELESKTDLSTLIAFSLIGLFILVMACINFINLSTATALLRAKEVGLRKVVGAGKLSLVGQFLGEAVVVSLIAFILCLALTELLRPVMSSLLQKQISFALLDNLWFWLLVPGCSIVIGITAGLYPAFYLSMFGPVKVLGGFSTGSPSTVLFRKILVTFQYAVSIALIVCALLGYSQLNYLLNKDLGFEKENLLVILFEDYSLKNEYNRVKALFERNSFVKGISGSSQIPGGFNTNGLSFNTASMENEKRSLPVFFVDYDFAQTLGLALIAGRNFTSNRALDTAGAFIINESAAKVLGDISVGERLQSFSGSPGHYEKWSEGPVVGIVKDYHFRNLYYRLQPQVLIADARRCDYMFLRLTGNDRQAVLASLESQWKSILPDQPFTYSFLEHELYQMYQSERNFAAILKYFCLLAVFIACIGLYGLAIAVTQQRIREFGIRRIMGASISSLVTMVSREFLILVLLANLIAWPAAYLLMRRWLNGYIYRIDISPDIFVVAALLTLFIAMLTVSHQALRAALANPVEALRRE
ncbi:MAG: ABC transporter permease [candidate division Zixibacteria bacterium]|nr:ABC transporter permease [candidate division Zixibacteria bacterium]